jgi:hypothetical protein
MTLLCVCTHHRKHHSIEDGCRCIMFGKQACDCLMFRPEPERVARRPNGWQKQDFTLPKTRKLRWGMRVDRRDFGDRIRLPVK